HRQQEKKEGGLNLFKTLKCNHFAATSPLQFYYKYVEKSSFRLRHYNFFRGGGLNPGPAWYMQRNCLTTEVHLPTLTLISNQSMYYQRMKTLEQINELRPCTGLSR
uniref:Uncharacterized protein n=1 Tax=Peromyscus maniculatus bairdii TaxID=230844 RepID=A0A8C8UDE5_PERMB